LENKTFSEKNKMVAIFENSNKNLTVLANINLLVFKSAFL
jgi:hypothetical protein